MRKLLLTMVLGVAGLGMFAVPATAEANPVRVVVAPPVCPPVTVVAPQVCAPVVQTVHYGWWNTGHYRRGYHYRTNYHTRYHYNRGGHHRR